MNKISQLTRDATSLFINELLEKNNSIICIEKSEKEALIKEKQLNFFWKNNDSTSVFYFPEWDCLPYDIASPSQRIISNRLDTLIKLCYSKSKKIVIITTMRAWIQKVPPKEIIKSSYVAIKKNEKYDFQIILKKLNTLGYRRQSNVFEPGEYSVRGSIIDIFPNGMKSPVRIDFFDNEVERIDTFDVSTQKRKKTLNKITLIPTSEIILNDNSKSIFRNKYINLFSKSSGFFYEQISNGIISQGCEHLSPMFYESMDRLEDYIVNSKLLINASILPKINEYNDYVDEIYQSRVENFSKNNEYPVCPKEMLYLSKDVLESSINDSVVFYENDYPNSKSYNTKIYDSIKKSYGSSLSAIYDVVKNSSFSTFVFTCHSIGVGERIKYVLKEFKINAEIIDKWPLEKGCFIVEYPVDESFSIGETLVISDEDILGKRARSKSITNKKKSIDTLNHININDLVVHKEHGICKYIGMETVNVGDGGHDCLILKFDGGDKLFLPVQNMDLISRFGEENDGITLDRLGSKSFQRKQGKVRERLQAVANYLFEIAAKRSLEKGLVCNYSNDYEAFCNQFEYMETDDQLSAIKDVENDLISGKPMDRLICGDVGFGKTEVAQRAAFIVASMKKQVIVVVPTTLLCRQHYETFKKRFEKTSIVIKQLSRLVSSKESNLIRNDLKDGKIDILISTHAIFSNSIEINDLGLIIVDEEQRFGVKQKEKLKSFKAQVHMMAMSATPIPRTLQLTLAGVRELSLITTPPMDRMPVRTFSIPFDKITIREAIYREIRSGGQVFYVSPRIKYLDKIYESLIKMMPDLKIAVAHGGMQSKEMEKLVEDFYARKYDILLATQIIEAGIDIPSANTMIIHKSDLFGLSQLYQLRGRVGRSTKQGYVYFTYSSEKPLSDVSAKRLEILQRLTGLGAGFSLASYDLEMRGAGNIVGEEQSGHIREVGVELYQNLLQEAIIQVQIEKSNDQSLVSGNSLKLWTPSINLGVSSMIPDTYVDDLDTRFDLYKKASKLKTKEDIHMFASDLRDRFGKLPDYLLFFLESLDMKNICLEHNISKVDVGPSGVVMQFIDNDLNVNPEKIINSVSRLGGRITKDHRMFFEKKWKSDKQKVSETKKLLKEFCSYIS